jgi:cytochrome P450
MAKNAKEYLGVVVPIANRYVDCIAGHLNEQNRLDDETCFRTLTAMFALEAVVKVVVGVDFPVLTVPLGEGVSFAHAVERMFTASTDCENMPWHVQFKTSRYKELKSAWEEMYSYPQKALMPVLEHYQKHGTLPEHTNGTVLPKLIEDFEAGNIGWEDVVGIGTQATAAAVDTTSQTAEYVLYNLATNPDVQAKLTKSLNESVGLNGPLEMTKEMYEAQQYLFAVVKESMRYTPTIGVHARTLVQDAVLGDYHVPAGKLVLINYFAMTRDPLFYPNPDVFSPERFLKADTLECPHAKKAATELAVRDKYAAIPFGHGARKCVGKGFAELDLHLAFAALLRKFEVRYDGPPLVQRERQLLRPAEPISKHFEFVPRQL